MARRRTKSVAQIARQADRIQQRLERGMVTNRYASESGRAENRRLQNRYDWVANARARYVGNAWRANGGDDYAQVPREVYMGSALRANEIPSEMRASARGVPRGITISQESLDAFRRRRDAAANGLNAG